MNHGHAAKYGRAFFDILFLRPNLGASSPLGLVGKLTLGMLALALFYVPIVFFSVLRSIANPQLIPYFLAIGAGHVLSKIMLYNSKRIQKRFSTIKSRKNFFLRIWLILEYIVFMWLVYLFYPLTCILAPISLLSMSFESMLGHNTLVNLFLQNSEQFVLFGSIASYIVFIFIDGYKKLKTGFLPDYLALYALLSVVSAAAEGGIKSLFEYWRVDISDITSVLSEIYSLSNSSMNIVASAMTVFFAVYSLYTYCGRVDDEEIGLLAQADPESTNSTSGQNNAAG